jgi:hypothetical protein
MPETAIPTVEQPTEDTSASMSGWDLRRFVLGFLIVLIFLFLTSPGFFALFSYHTVMINDLRLNEWEIFVYDGILPHLKSLPAEGLILLVAAFPVAVATVCYNQTDQTRLNIFGKICLLLGIIGAIVGGVGFLLIDPASAELRNNLSAEEKLTILNSLCEKSLYINLLYTLTFLGLKPK